MTIAVNSCDTPWCAPVYFVWMKGGFYFFSNLKSRHVPEADGSLPAAASVFKDSDSMEQIYGLQMSGKVDCEYSKKQYLLAVQAYIDKFSFLKRQFGTQLLLEPSFFKEKFKSRLYVFLPEKMVMSDLTSKHHRISISPQEMADWIK